MFDWILNTPLYSSEYQKVLKQKKTFVKNRLKDFMKEVKCYFLTFLRYHKKALKEKASKEGNAHFMKTKFPSLSQDKHQNKREISKSLFKNTSKHN